MINKKTDITYERILSLVGINQSKFYSWTSRLNKPNYHNSTLPKSNWLLEEEKQALLAYAKRHPGEGYRRLTYMMMDEDVTAVSPSTTYRLLKGYSLLNEWNTVKDDKKGSGFVQPTHPHEHWHTDIKYVNFHGSFLFLISVIDGYSRYIVHHELKTSMTELDIEVTIMRALEKFPGVKPRIISDNGGQFVSSEFGKFIQSVQLEHVRTSVNYPQSNGKIERYNRTIGEECLSKKPLINLDDARRQVTKYVDFYNNERLHGSLYYLTPADFLYNRFEDKLLVRENKLREAKLYRFNVRMAALN
jgi:transposase InsO family protein